MTVNWKIGWLQTFICAVQFVSAMLLLEVSSIFWFKENKKNSEFNSMYITSQNWKGLCLPVKINLAIILTVFYVQGYKRNLLQSWWIYRKGHPDTRIKYECPSSSQWTICEANWLFGIIFWQKLVCNLLGQSIPLLTETVYITDNQ